MHGRLVPGKFEGDDRLKISATARAGDHDDTNNAEGELVFAPPRQTAKLNMKDPLDFMKARILLLLGSFILGACEEPQLSSGGQPQIASPSPSPRAFYLLRRVAVATEESLYGLDAGTELKLIEERPERLLVEAQGVQFEIDRRDATSDRGQVERLLARAAEEKAIRQVSVATQLQIEDQKFLAEENKRRRNSAAMQIVRLRSAIDSARAEIARLEAESTSTGGGHAGADEETSNRAPSEKSARRQRISALQTYIADRDREMQMLSDAMASWE